MELRFADIMAKQTLDNWGDQREMDASERLREHLQEKFGSSSYTVIAVKEEDDHVVVTVASSQWERPREFGLDGAGRLFW